MFLWYFVVVEERGSKQKKNIITTPQHSPQTSPKGNPREAPGGVIVAVVAVVVLVVYMLNDKDF